MVAVRKDRRPKKHGLWRSRPE